MVKLPPVLRPAAGGVAEVIAEGESVADVLDDLFREVPALRAWVGASGGTAPFAWLEFTNVYLNDEMLDVPEGLDCSVSHGDSVVLLPAMSGGADSSR